MPNEKARRLINYLYGVESRVTDLEQGRPGETATRQVETVSEDMQQADAVSDQSRSDYTAAWDTLDQGWDRSQWADGSGSGGI